MVYNLKFTSQKGHLICCNPAVINSGALQIAEAEFLLDPSWNGYTVTATFCADGNEVSVILNSKRRCTVPWEVLQNAGKELKVEVIGSNGVKKYPSDYCCVGIIGEGCSSVQTGEEPTLDLYDQMLDLVNRSYDAAEKAVAAAEDAKIAAESAACVIYDESGKPYKLGIENGTLYIESKSE